MKRTVLVAGGGVVAVLVVIGLVFTSRSGSASARIAGECRPAAKKLASSTPAVSTVSVFWDVSGSMKPYAKGSTKRAAFGALVQDLDRRWIRKAEGGSIEAVRHLGIGSQLVSLRGPPKAGELIAPWTNLPIAALRIAADLADNPAAAAVLVSDMQLELPPETGSLPICGKVLAPSGGGVAPRLFAQCLNEGWREKVPEGLQIRSMLFARPTEGSQGLLFLTVFARSPEFARGLIQEVLKDASLAATEPRELELVSHSSVAACGAIDLCRFVEKSEIILRASQENACNFVIAGGIEAHTLRCTASLPRAGSSGLVELRIAEAEIEGTAVSGGHSVARLGRTEKGTDYADVRLALNRVTSREASAAECKVRLLAEWRAVEDVDGRLATWLGESAAGNYPYLEVFGPIARDLVPGLRKPTCDSTWTINYTR